MCRCCEWDSKGHPANAQLVMFAQSAQYTGSSIPVWERVVAVNEVPDDVRGSQLKFRFSGFHVWMQQVLRVFPAETKVDGSPRAASNAPSIEVVKSYAPDRVRL